LANQPNQPNRAIVITGCQRSGTTMLNLVMDSHPQVVGIDEKAFDPARILAYLEEPEYGPWVCFKVPMLADAVAAWRTIPGVKVLWAQRDPRDVVSSMLRLSLDAEGMQTSWAGHPAGASREAAKCARVLEGRMPADLTPYWTAYQAALPAQREGWDADAQVLAAALCWRLKQEMRPLYDAAGLNPRTVAYERLVADPQGELKGHLAFCGLPWHPDVLRHHQLHHGTSIGDTDNTRAIDRRSVERWRKDLTPEQIARVAAVCGPAAALAGYEL
jgi:hypothetical protein